MPKFSRVKKLDGIRSWSLQAGISCPGSYDSDGEIVDACLGCYAKYGHYNFPNVKAPRLHNMQDWKRDDWEQDMLKELDNDRYFRWFDSGDIHHHLLASKILNICEKSVWVKHWIPTRSYKTPKIFDVVEQIKRLPNVVVRYSSDSIIGEYDDLHGSTIIPGFETDDLNLTVCESHLSNGQCNGCRKCWNPDVKVIAYPAHGRKMLKLIRDKEAGKGV